MRVCVRLCESEGGGKYVARRGIRGKESTSLGKGIAGGRQGPPCYFLSSTYKLQSPPFNSAIFLLMLSLFLPLQSHIYHIIRALSFSRCNPVLTYCLPHVLSLPRCSPIPTILLRPTDTTILFFRKNRLHVVIMVGVYET